MRATRRAAKPLELWPEPVPFVKWAGGKGQLLPSFRKLFPPSFGRYFEPFLGGGAVFLALQPERVTLSDLNPELVHAWHVVRNRPEDLMRCLDRHAYERGHYYRVRSQLPAKLDPVQRAARFIYLNKCCYNGLYRVNRSGGFNVPFGRFARPPRLYDRQNLLRISRLLGEAAILCCPFEEAASRARRGDFIYFDPPYQPRSRTSFFTSYTDGSFTSEDQARLAAVVRALDRRGCLVAASNSDTREVSELYAGFRIEKLLANRAINSRATGRGKISELLVLNF